MRDPHAVRYYAGHAPGALVLTPTGRLARVQGIVGPRLLLAYTDPEDPTHERITEETVLLMERLVRTPPRKPTLKDGC